MKTTPVLLVDNYDSFTYNLVHYLEALNCKVQVVRSDKLTENIINKYHKIVISPGSGLPKDTVDLLNFIKKYASSKSILGICLGQQAIAELFGGSLKALPSVKHGVSCRIKHLENDLIYNKIPTNFSVGLYFSWETLKLPTDLIPTAVSNEGIIMSFKHNKFDLKAIQYHPESIMTNFGKNILKNWLYYENPPNNLIEKLE
jgi:anthranilate synthase component 2